MRVVPRVCFLTTRCHCWHSICQAPQCQGQSTSTHGCLAHPMKLALKSVDWSKRLPVILLAAGICGVAVAAMPMIKKMLTLPKEEPAKSESAKESVPAAVLVRDAKGELLQPPRLRVSPRVVSAFRLTADAASAARLATQPRELPPQIGSLGYDNERWAVIRSRFPGELVEITQAPAPKAELPSAPWPPTSEFLLKTTRPLEVGDRVKKGDQLAVVWSKELGEKKGALVDAVIDLRLEQDRLTRYAKLVQEGAISEAAYKEQENRVQRAKNGVLTAERTLRFWRLEPDEIEAVRKEAEGLQADKRDLEQEKKWARVEQRAPRDGTIVEKNTNVGDMVDPSRDTPLFRIADLSNLQIWVHPPEEYLPLLRPFLSPNGSTTLRWKVRVESDTKAPPIELPVLRLAPSLEPNQHTPILIGRMPNPDGQWLIGQFILATLIVPPLPDLVEIPTAALNEVDGQSLVLIQPNASEPEYAVRRVAVVWRFKDKSYIKSKLSESDEDAARADKARGLRPVEPLLPGELVLTRGVVELTAALEELLAKERIGARKN